MRVALLNDSRQSLGGGWTFMGNLQKGLLHAGVDVVTDPLQADVALCSGVTMVAKETIRAVKERGVKLVVRLDNVPRNSRNRGGGTPRLKSYTEQADMVVWQCQWAKDYLRGFIDRDGPIIYNGIDTEIFTDKGAYIDFGDKKNVYLYSRFNRDETKNWEVAWYEFQLIARENPDAKLVIVGKWSSEPTSPVHYNFDFFRGEKIYYQGIIDNPIQMARVMRGCGYLLATYFNDCFSNTYLEAMACGLKLDKVNMSGGTPEMLKIADWKGADFFSIERMTQEYISVFKEVIG